ncbi:MAG: hypothetical protein QOJ26_289 [Thermoplasmata archaeon]|jgi:hypothetical protein|nr:hypothetical protein [Thermoplasmata archaeon]MEA3165437.1 hypothetical protein [Thermoplasmata archaeon]
MRLAVLLFGCLLVLPALPGCLDGQQAPPATGGVGASAGDPFEAARSLMTGVPCEAAVGEATSDNLRDLASIQFEEGGVGDIDVRGPLLATTRSLHDVSDPLHPMQTADFETLEIHAGGDIKFLSDNKTLVTGGGGGLLLIDARDPWNPVIEDEWSFDEFAGVNLPGGSVFLNAHMMGTALIGGVDWVFLAPNSNSGIWILRVDGEPGSRQLTYVTQTLPAEGGPLGPHDLFVHQDPFTSQWLLYSADGFHGWTVFDLADPTSPLPIGGLILPQPGYTHTIQAARFGERRIVVTIAEVGENLLQVYDATVLQAPILLAEWQVAPLATTPQHNINIVGDYLYVAHYGYGMYVFDLTTVPGIPVVGTATFAPVAHYDPVPGGDPYIAGIGGFEAVYDVVLQDGLLYVSGFSDPLEGVEVLGFGCIVPGDATQRSVG